MPKKSGTGLLWAMRERRCAPLYRQPPRRPPRGVVSSEGANTQSGHRNLISI